jgi:hypothetical protein
MGSSSPISHNTADPPPHPSKKRYDVPNEVPRLGSMERRQPIAAHTRNNAAIAAVLKRRDAFDLPGETSLMGANT